MSPRAARSGRSGSSGTWLGTIVAALALVALTAGATALLLAPTRPSALAPGEDPTTFPLTAQEFSDRRTVDVTISSTEGMSLEAPSGGRITSWRCIPGEAVASASTLMSIDDQPILALATSMPLWRDLAAGDHGADVESLQRELARLGADVTVDGRLGAQTLAALDDLFDAIGDTAEWQSVPLARIQWLPGSSVVVQACTAALGDRVEEGDPIASLPGGITRLEVGNYPDDLYPGDRVVVINDVDVPVDPDGHVSSEGIALLDGITLNQSTENDAPSTFNAALRLAEPVVVAAVPPSSLYDVEGSDGCVTAHGKPHAVTIAGSQLGETFVVFATTTMPDVVDLPALGEAPCR